MLTKQQIHFGKKERCSLAEAQIINFRKKSFNLWEKDVISRTSTGITVRMEFDRWEDFNERDFELLGIECIKFTLPEPITFESEVVVHSKTERDNHGMSYDVVDKVCIVLPEDLAKYNGQKVEVTIKIT